MSTMTAREFNHDVGAAKRAAATEPVIITDRGTPSFVLLSVHDFRRLSGAQRSLVDRLRIADEGIDFEPERLDFTPRVPEL